MLRRLIEKIASRKDRSTDILKPVNNPCFRLSFLAGHLGGLLAQGSPRLFRKVFDGLFSASSSGCFLDVLSGRAGLFCDSHDFPPCPTTDAIYVPGRRIRLDPTLNGDGIALAILAVRSAKPPSSSPVNCGD